MITPVVTWLITAASSQKTALGWHEKNDTQTLLVFGCSHSDGHQLWRQSLQHIRTDHETICHPSSDSQTCHTLDSDCRQTRLYLVSWTTAQCSV